LNHGGTIPANALAHRIADRRLADPPVPSQQRVDALGGPPMQLLDITCTADDEIRGHRPTGGEEPADPIVYHPNNYTRK
jgi:hypothetical protein